MIPALGKHDKIAGKASFSTVYLGECIAPYELKAVLPVHRPTMTMPLSLRRLRSQQARHLPIW